MTPEEILIFLLPLFVGIVIGIPIALLYSKFKLKKIEKNIPKNLQAKDKVSVEDKVPTPQSEEFKPNIIHRKIPKKQEGGEKTWEKKKKKKPLKIKKKKGKKRSKK